MGENVEFPSNGSTAGGYLAPAREGDEIARAGIGFARGLEHAVANAENALHALQLFRGQQISKSDLAAYKLVSRS